MRITQVIYRLLMAAAVSLLAGFAVPAASVMPDTPAIYGQADTWKTEKGNTVLASPERIQAINSQIEKNMYGSLDSEPASISGDRLRSYVNAYTMDTSLYVNGSPITAEMAGSLKQKAVSLIKDENPVRYGVITTRADMRSFPTSQRAFEDAYDHDYDMWQETAVDPGTPVRIYHMDGDRKFFFVRTPFYRGWVAAGSVAVTSKSEWDRYAHPKEWAVVTSRLLSVTVDGKKKLYQMGAYLPLEGEKMLIPERGDKGYLKTITAKASFDEGLHKGYLPYTENNIVDMAFRHLGARYGWGGMFNSVDCSSYAQDVFRTMGINIPRNGDDQARAFSGTNLQGLTEAQKWELIKKSPLGTVLYTPYHVMIYLGEKNGVPYMIHAASSYGKKTGQSVTRTYIKKVVVSRVDLLGGSGSSLVSQMVKLNTYL